MHKKLIFSLLVIMLVMSGTSLSQGQSDPTPATFQPLGRFDINLSSSVTSPNGVHRVGLQIKIDYVTLQPDAESEDAEPETIEIREYFLAQFDVRGGRQLWRVSLGELPPERIRFSPDGSIILVEIVSEDEPEEIFLTFYDPANGEIISETSNIDLIRTPIIPGDVYQALSTSINFSDDNAHVIVDYYRRAEAPKCAVWRIADASLVWEIDSACGRGNPSGTALAFRVPDTNSFSDYPQLEVYDVATGNILQRSYNEVLSFNWLDDAHIMIERPYGEPPVVWHVINDTIAALELPYLSGNLWPGRVYDRLAYIDSSATYFWDINTGRLTLTLDYAARGHVLMRDDGIMILFRGNWRLDEDEESFVDTYQALDLETGDVLWERDWPKGDVRFYEDRWMGTAYNYASGMLEFIDLDTGNVLYELRTYTENATVLPDWDYVIENLRGIEIIWGPGDETGRFPNPPHAQIVGNAPLYPEPNTTFEARGELPDAQLVWLDAQTEDGQWFSYRMYGTRYWVAAEHIDLLVSAASIRVIEP